MDEQFMRTEMLLGSEAMARLRHAHVAVFGLGGVGSWCAEALARSGVGRLTLVDEDTVGLTNLNRQAQALHSTLGMEKAIAMAQRVLDINPQCTVRPISKRYEAASRDDSFLCPLSLRGGRHRLSLLQAGSDRDCHQQRPSYHLCSGHWQQTGSHAVSHF